MIHEFYSKLPTQTVENLYFKPKNVPEDEKFPKTNFFVENLEFFSLILATKKSNDICKILIGKT